LSLLDTLKSLSGSPSEASASPMQTLLPSVLEMLGRGGGLNSLVRSFEQNGLGNIISSWIGTGQNMPVSPAQVETGLGSERIGELAEKSGLSPETVKTQLSEALPHLIDSLTPAGHTGDTAKLLTRGKELLESLLASQKGA
jgi:uncharacterized protein YidB (DUF937 family)